MSSSVIVIVPTARERRPPSHACACSKSGQVDTTIVTAQIDATRNGRKIQKLLPIKAPRASSWKIVRARSFERSLCIHHLVVSPACVLTARLLTPHPPHVHPPPTGLRLSSRGTSPCRSPRRTSRRP